MRRLFWIGVGAAGAVVLVDRARRAARRYTPAGVAEQVEEAGQRAGSAVQGALATFRSAFETRERDLVATLLVQPEGGDAGAVLKRRDRQGEGYLAGPRDVPADRPRGRVDDDDPLYDF
ncbi:MULTISPECIES: hypothetical protein [unclassified Actinotalea]|uniref:hypothetical protein n=1 Tax=unclassified Actinotalea TaxID=2638618 RepID=UPI0015F6C2BB|nr:MULTISPECIES: hypothetical protein [unclassified Actinotalea]